MAEGWTVALRGWVEDAARAAGFAACGVADGSDGAEDAERFAAWVEAGHAGEMAYLTRRDADGVLVRGDVRASMPWARSVVVCALNYNAGGVQSLGAAEAGAGWIARYAWSGRHGEDGTLAATDYHAELLGRLREVEASLQARVTCETRCYVDTGPMLERGLAARAGVGWIGRNTCVLNQELGSWLLLGVIVTSLAVEGVASLPAQDRCGSCTRCIEACPTGALLDSCEPGAVRMMDATRCIAYLTIEKKGSIDEELRAGMGRQVFGCDICQEVCPWNGRAPVERHAGMEPRAELVNPALEWLAAMDGREFKRRFKGSPLERTGRTRVLRNVAIAMGNSGEQRFVPQLQAWVEDEREGEALRGGAAWAVSVLEGRAKADCLRE